MSHSAPQRGKTQEGCISSLRAPQSNISCDGASLINDIVPAPTERSVVATVLGQAKRDGRRCLEHTVPSLDGGELREAPRSYPSVSSKSLGARELGHLRTSETLPLPESRRAPGGRCKEVPYSAFLCMPYIRRRNGESTTVAVNEQERTAGQDVGGSDASPQAQQPSPMPAFPCEQFPFCHDAVACKSKPDVPVGVPVPWPGKRTRRPAVLVRKWTLIFMHQLASARKPWWSEWRPLCVEAMYRLRWARVGN
ncbi:uncharacterized protein TRIREDRAFT_102385 [Trichoderma reesei QM6a]|uniref:Predicted protein n=1 Tax=Hypocrea jecorina (strain QM6a) TaxID=431241 RepID=G0R8Y6_HYPJQ|nr:uncharacterized protein TRIREDRAFT_102385 [Trichoderma reesei QM6a]EGR52128.1 predicted protein [Trichoderma reesei QM6a]